MWNASRVVVKRTLDPFLGRDGPRCRVEDRLSVVVHPHPYIPQIVPLDLEDGAVGLWADVEEEIAVFGHDIFQACDDAGSASVA